MNYKPLNLRLYVAVAAVTAAFIAFTPDAQACKDSMHFAPDKKNHFAVSAALGVGARALVSDNATAFGLALLPGVAKEFYDLKHPDKDCASYSDLAWDAIGAAVGVYSTHWIIQPNKIIYKTQF